RPDPVFELRRRDQIRLIRRAVAARQEDVRLAQNPGRVLRVGVVLQVVVVGVAAGQLVLDRRDAAIFGFQRVPRAVDGIEFGGWVLAARGPGVPGCVAAGAAGSWPWTRASPASPTTIITAASTVRIGRGLTAPCVDLNTNLDGDAPHRRTRRTRHTCATLGP